jgi:hypothetical protein
MIKFYCNVREADSVDRTTRTIKGICDDWPRTFKKLGYVRPCTPPSKRGRTPVPLIFLSENMANWSGILIGECDAQIHWHCEKTHQQYQYLF